MSTLLTEEEEKLFKKINELSLAEVEVSLKNAKVKINCVDENGMTPLETGAYKGHYDICKLLIERGAHVNSDKHVHGYTALMFAGLGGHLRVVNLLLENGASVSAVNSVGRTASQMSAFVGQHKVVTLINNFIPREEIDYFTKPHDLDKVAKLPSKLAEPFYQFVRQINIHPVKLVLYLQANDVLLENSTKVSKILELMCEREMKKEDPNETLAFKFHFLSFVLKYIVKQMEATKPDEKVFECLLKSWLKGRDEDAFPILLEQFLRQSIREFPYRDCTLFIQLLKTLSAVKIGEEPSAISILLQTVNGQKGYEEESAVCSTCGEPCPAKKCAQCKKVQYCDQRCQKLHWFSHKKVCLQLKEMAAVEEAQMLEAIGNGSRKVDA